MAIEEVRDGRGGRTVAVRADLLELKERVASLQKRIAELERKI